MRKIQKNMILELAETFDEAHKSAEIMLKNNNIKNAQMLLVDCQKTAVQIVNIIEKSEGLDCPAIVSFSEYCSTVFNFFQEISAGNIEIDFDELRSKLSNAKKCIEDIKVKLEVVFFPYKASMWDSLESIWRAANDDPDCDAYVVPIPYYDRNPDHSLGKFHYEGNEYPDYVPITDYREYDYKAHKPDIAYIHNPYDDCNYVTTVDMRYYSRCLKPYVGCLVYVPYFVQEPGVVTQNFVTNPGVWNADFVVVPDELTANGYIRFYNESINSGAVQGKFKNAENKFLPLGSPKLDKVMSLQRDKNALPEEWRNLIYQPDGTRKKVIFYNTGLGALLRDVSMLKKISKVLTFFESRNDMVLWWRPHPLYASTLKSMRPEFYNIYMSMVNSYKKSGYGIFDETGDLYTALAEADAYYGDGSSVVFLCKARKIPIMIQNPNMNIKESDKYTLTGMAACEHDNCVWLSADYCNGLYRCDLNTKTTEKIAEFPDALPFAQQLYSAAVNYKNRIIFVPRNSKSICIYDTVENCFQTIPLKNQYVAHAFFDYVLKENVLYLVPHRYPAIVKLNMDDFSITYIEDCIRFDNASSPYFGQQCVLVKDDIYIPCVFTNGILRLDTKTDKVDIIRIGSQNMSYFGIAYHSGYIYLSINAGNGVIEWNINSNECDIIPGSEHMKFYNLYISNDKLIALGNRDEPFYEYSLNDCKLFKKNMKYAYGIFSYSLEYRRYFKYNNEPYYVSSRTGCIHSGSDDDIVIKLECGKSYDKMMYFDQKSSNYMFETAQCSFLDFLKIIYECVTNKINFEYTIDIKTNCGEAVHNSIKRFL